MSINKFLPHVLVLPEDDANNQLANGFLLYPSLSIRHIQILPSVGGWRKVLDSFEFDHADEMKRYTNRYMVLLIDFDDVADRLSDAKSRIPLELADRVFILGARSEPESLKRVMGNSYEAIGFELAKDCHEDSKQAWGHTLLCNNAGELDRLRDLVRPILFPRS